MNPIRAQTPTTKVFSFIAESPAALTDFLAGHCLVASGVSSGGPELFTAYVSREDTGAPRPTIEDDGPGVNCEPQ